MNVNMQVQALGFIYSLIPCLVGATSFAPGWDWETSGCWVLQLCSPFLSHFEGWSPEPALYWGFGEAATRPYIFSCFSCLWQQSLCGMQQTSRPSCSRKESNQPLPFLWPWASGLVGTCFPSHMGIVPAQVAPQLMRTIKQVCVCS